MQSALIRISILKNKKKILFLFYLGENINAQNCCLQSVHKSCARQVHAPLRQFKYLIHGISPPILSSVARPRRASVFSRSPPAHTARKDALKRSDPVQAFLVCILYTAAKNIVALTHATYTERVIFYFSYGGQVCPN